MSPAFVHGLFLLVLIKLALPVPVEVPRGLAIDRAAECDRARRGACVERIDRCGRTGAFGPIPRRTVHSPRGRRVCRSVGTR